MLPFHIQDQLQDPRFKDYQRNLDLYKGDHYKHFNYDEQEKKVNAYEYLCYGIINTAIATKTNLIWHDKPQITFTNPQTQETFERLRESTNFDYILQQATAYSYLFGDCLVKVMIDDDQLTASVDDKKLCLYLQTPQNWFPSHDQYSPNRHAKSDTLMFKREVEDKGTAYLLETHEAGKIIWTAYFEEKGQKEARQVPVLQYFADVMEGVVGDKKYTDKDIEIVYTTNCTYSLLQRLKAKTSIDSYFGQSDLNLPVISKINALNNYANLADVIIVTNSFPKLILSENAGNIMKRIVEELNSNSSGQETSGVADLDLTTMPGKSFLSRQNYAQSYMYRDLVNQMKAFVDGSQGGQTKYLTNDFSLDEIRKQHEVFFTSAMTELGISEVFYNPALTTGAHSGVAYKRLMTTTLNAVEVTKRNLQTLIPRLALTMLELANQGIETNTPEMPKVVFSDGIIADEKEILENIILKVQNDLLPLKDAMMQANDITEERALEWLLEMAPVEPVTDEVESDEI